MKQYTITLKFKVLLLAILFLACKSVAVPKKDSVVDQNVIANNPSVSKADKPNVLFIAIDDMNDWVGFLDGHPQAITPNMDMLAKRGVNFTNAHCVAPACGPSRSALLFGVPPHESGLYPFYNQVKMDQDLLAGYTSIPQLFKDSGYNTYGSGKIHHGREWSYKKDGGKLEWTENNEAYLETLPELVYDYEGGFGKGKKMAFCPTESPLEHHPDYVTAMFGNDILRKDHDKPFFLALGFVKPHLPFVCPKEYFDLYPERIKPPSIKANDLEDVPWVGRSMAKLGDDFNYRQDDKWQKVHRAYLACNSWTDANIGRVIDQLNESKYRDNTIIVLWSDHGYHQGEKRSFRKFSLWNEATKVPFIIIDPRENYQGVCDEGVSLQDIYPTLTEMAGLEKPEYVAGNSLVPWLLDPAKPKDTPAVITWGRGNHSVKTREWRYTRYFDNTEELYHSTTDENEWYNLSENWAYGEIKDELSRWLPKAEAPLVLEGKALHNIVDADQPSLDKTKTNWDRMNKKIKPALD